MTHQPKQQASNTGVHGSLNNSATETGTQHTGTRTRPGPAHTRDGYCSDAHQASPAPCRELSPVGSNTDRSKQTTSALAVHPDRPSPDTRQSDQECHRLLPTREKQGWGATTATAHSPHHSLFHGEGALPCHLTPSMALQGLRAAAAASCSTACASECSAWRSRGLTPGYHLQPPAPTPSGAADRAHRGRPHTPRPCAQHGLPHRPDNKRASTGQSKEKKEQSYSKGYKNQSK